VQCMEELSQVCCAEAGRARSLPLGVRPKSHMTSFVRRFILLALVWFIILWGVHNAAMAFLERDAWTGYAVLRPAEQDSSGPLSAFAPLIALLGLLFVPPALGAWLRSRRNQR